MIGVVHGGYSTEREISTVNATYINEALKRLGYDTVMLDYDDELPYKLTFLGVDFVFLCVQGKGHGDGTLQGLLDFMRIPYTGSDMTSSAIINDKLFCKELFRFNNITTPDWIQLDYDDYKAGKYDASLLQYPIVSKAPSQGASYGIVMIDSEKEFYKVEESFKYDKTILLEAFASGVFVTVGLLQSFDGITALPCVECIDKRAVNEKLKLYTGEFDVVKSSLSPIIQKEIQDIAVKVFRLFRCRDYARVDFIVSDDQKRIDVLEINAVPGLQRDSFLPREAKIAGMAYDDLIKGILLNARRRADV